MDEEILKTEHVAGRTAGRWLDVKLAAEELGISSDAVRKRISRGTLRYAKRDDGSVRVWLDWVDDRLDADQPSKQPPGWPEARHRLDDLIDAKDEALRDLRDQLEHMRRDSERKDAIIMQMAQANSALAVRVPELEAASGQREAPETSSEEADKGISPFKTRTNRSAALGCIDYLSILKDFGLETGEVPLLPKSISKAVDAPLDDASISGFFKFLVES